MNIAATLFEKFVCFVSPLSEGWVQSLRQCIRIQDEIYGCLWVNLYKLRVAPLVERISLAQADNTCQLSVYRFLIKTYKEP